MKKAKKALSKDNAVDFTPNSLKILEKRYLLKDQNGVVAETVEGMFERIAKVVASPDAQYGYEEKSQIEFYNLISSKKFFPNSPTFTGAGTPLGQLAACFVLPIEDDLGKHPDGIFSTLRNAALIQQVGGGNGFSFSDLRPKGTLVKSSMGKATGP
ncbi:MAG: ribonucleotide reductase, partial [Candidatus Nealsonbacteria bacterium CG23_combo_of_CG06-09_8_20_14_all_37_18]